MIILRMHYAFYIVDTNKEETYYPVFKFSPLPTDDIQQHCSGNPHIKSHHSCTSSLKTICSKNSKSYAVHQLLSASFIKAQNSLKYPKLFCSILCIPKLTRSDEVRH